MEKIYNNGKEIEANSKKIKETNDSIDRVISKKIQENSNDSKLDEIDDILESLSL